MNLRKQFGDALRAARKLRNASQESLDSVTSRTYVSSLERGMKSPTLDKVDQIARALGVHPLSLLTYSYVAGLSLDEKDAVLQRIKIEVLMLDDQK